MTFEERIVEAVENAVVHDIGRYNTVQFKKFMLPDEVIEDVYKHVDMEKIKRYLTENIEQLIAKIEALKERVGIKKTIRDYGVKEEDFLATLDEMVEQAFDDQCTGANPRYPLMSEIKEMYLRAYYGK